MRQPGGQWEDVFDNVDVSWKPAVMEVGHKRHKDVY